MARCRRWVVSHVHWILLTHTLKTQQLHVLWSVFTLWWYLAWLSVWMIDLASSACPLFPCRANVVTTCMVCVCSLHVCTTECLFTDSTCWYTGKCMRLSSRDWRANSDLVRNIRGTAACWLVSVYAGIDKAWAHCHVEMKAYYRWLVIPKQGWGRSRLLALHSGMALGVSLSSAKQCCLLGYYMRDMATCAIWY